MEEGRHGFREAGVRLDLVGLVAGGCFVGLCGLVVLWWLVGYYVQELFCLESEAASLILLGCGAS